MAMNKAEKQVLEDALTLAALRWTAPVAPDLVATDYKVLTKGYLYNSYSPRVEPACSTTIYHSFGRGDKTTSQGSRDLYSTKLLALRAMRYEVEKEAAKKLRAIDKMIEAEQVTK